MKIEIWSDYVCPFCYLGKRRLELALKDYEHRDDVEIIFRSFELDPTAKKVYSESLHEIIANKYGISVEQAKASNHQLVEQAKEVGLNFNFDDIIPTNTFDAHRLSHYAKTQGKEKSLTERILKAYFVDSLNISDHRVLAGLAEEVGLPKDMALQVLESGSYTDEVRKDEEDAARIGIQGVPYFIFNDRYKVSGAQSPEVLLEVLQKAYHELK